MKFLRNELEALKEQGLQRSLRRHNDSPGRTIKMGGISCINFSSNNYLGLANHPELVLAAKNALVHGTGSSASRLVTGNLALHEQLESSLADFHTMPAARLFNSGYQANIGLLSCLSQKGDLIVSDALNHASMIDGCRLSKADLNIVPHRDLDSYESCLRNSKAKRTFLITEGVFSMDGDLAPLKELRTLCDRYGAFLIVDDVHALGVLGKKGAGLASQCGVIPDAIVGGLGKAFGSCGGYVAGSKELAEYLLHKARSFVFSTALPASVLAASLAAISIVKSEEGRARQGELQSRIEEMREGLSRLGRLGPGAGHSSIFPVLVGDSMEAVQLTQTLLEQGIFCQAIRPPTVPKGTARLRIALSSEHRAEDVRLFLHLLEQNASISG